MIEYISVFDFTNEIDKGKSWKTWGRPEYWIGGTVGRAMKPLKQLHP